MSDELGYRRLVPLALHLCLLAVRPRSEGGTCLARHKQPQCRTGCCCLQCSCFSAASLPRSKLETVAVSGCTRQPTHDIGSHCSGMHSPALLTFVSVRFIACSGCTGLPGASTASATTPSAGVHAQSAEADGAEALCGGRASVQHGRDTTA